MAKQRKETKCAKVMVSEHKQQEDKGWKLEEKGEAYFHGFGWTVRGMRECHSIAIVEWPDGTIDNVPVEHVRFIKEEI